MPELPEVEIVKQSLEKTIVSKRIKKFIIFNRNLRFKVQKNLNKLIEQKKIIRLNRISKYLIFEFEKSSYLLMHLGMSGTLHLIKGNNFYKTNLSFYHSSDLPKKHNHIELNFTNFKIIYNDPRRFGFIKYFHSKNNLDFYLSRIGLEPLNQKFNFSYLKKNLINKQKNIKNFLLDQKYISGIGNIYANEILFCSKIHPIRLCNSLKDKEIIRIIKYSKKVLKKAIKKGGSSIRNFKNSVGKSGNYQKEFLVYAQETKKCPSANCKEKIKKIFISNRSSYFCKNCQK